jgi:hypothetical protein
MWPSPSLCVLTRQSWVPVFGFVQQLVLHSQPSLTLPLQFWKPESQLLMAQPPPALAHFPVPFAGAHAVSQPSAGLVLQSKKPAVQVSPQVPLHVPLSALQQVVLPLQICEPEFSVYVQVPPGPEQVPAGL